MPTLDDLEAAVADLRRSRAALAEAQSRFDSVQGQARTIQTQIATAKAAVDANEDTLRTIAGQFASGK